MPYTQKPFREERFIYRAAVEVCGAVLITYTPASLEIRVVEAISSLTRSDEV